MTDSDPLRRYVEAGIAFTQLTRARAEAIIKELVKAGDLQREQAQERVDELLDRSRRSTEALMGLIRNEVGQQLSSMGFATREDLDKLEARIEGRLAATAGGGRTKPVAKPVKRAAAKTVAKTVAKKVAKKAAVPPPGTAARTSGSSTAPDQG